MRIRLFTQRREYSVCVLLPKSGRGRICVRHVPVHASARLPCPHRDCADHLQRPAAPAAGCFPNEVSFAGVLLKDVSISQRHSNLLRCGNSDLFGMPAAISTVDKYQGSQNDYILLSLVRTKVPVRCLTPCIP